MMSHASYSYGRDTEEKVRQAMLEVSEGRECRADFDSANSRMSISIRKANGFWVSSLVPRYSRDYIKAEDKMLAFMNLIPKGEQPISMADRINFAVEFAKAHNRD
jgi:hypothetical protein